MQPHQQRVVDEASELSDRLDKLTAFIDSNAFFQTLPELDKSLMVLQRSSMQTLLGILNLRIARF